MAAFQAARFGGKAHVAVALVDFLQDVLALIGFASLVQRAEVFVALFSATMHEHWQMPALDAVNLRIENQDALENILQLTDIAGPGILFEQIDCVVSDLYARPSILAPENAEKFADQRLDVLFSLAQRWDEERHHVEAVKKVLPKIAF